jgi:GNAT superfamily N-acetyltransferase
MSTRNSSTHYPRPASGLDVIPGVVAADPAEAHDIATLVADAFFTLAPTIWLVADPAERARVFRDWLLPHVEHAFTYGHVDVLQDRSAAAIWFDSHAPQPPNLEARRLAACGRWVEYFVYLEGQMDRHHPHEPHDYLAFIATRTGLQGKGRGSILLQTRLDQLDAEGRPAYLEAASDRLVGVYEKFGFTQRDPFYLSADGPALYPMWREPQHTV